MSFLNLMRVFLAALYNGLDKPSGKTFREGTGHFTEFSSYDQLFRAWQRQIRYFARKTVEIDTAVDTALERKCPG